MQSCSQCVPPAPSGGSGLEPAREPRLSRTVAGLILAVKVREHDFMREERDPFKGGNAVGVRATEGSAAPLVLGVMNLAWAVTALVTPLLAGLAEGSSGVRLAFAATGGVAAVVALALLGPRPRVRIDALPS